MSKRPILAIPTPGLTPGTPATEKPELTWIAPAELLIDEAYQRDLSEASPRLIRRIVEGWDWRRFKPPIVAWTDEGLEVIDGQHSAIAAETHPLITSIPVVVVSATAQADRAQIDAAWHALPAETRDRLGIAVVDMVFQSFVSGAAYSPSNRAVPGRSKAAHAIRDAADNACNARLTDLYREIEDLLPDLFGPAGENPDWAVAMGARR